MSSQSSKDPNIGQMLATVVGDMSHIVNSQVELAKAELRQSAQKGAAAGIAGVIAAVLGLVTAIFLFLTLAWVLINFGLSPWVAFGIVTILLLILTTIFGLIAKKKMAGVHGPQKALESVETTAAELVHPHKPATPSVPKQVTGPNKSLTTAKGKS